MFRNRLTLISRTGRVNKHGLRLAIFICDCGTQIERPAAWVRRNKIKSCGCLKNDYVALVGHRNRKHGDCKSSEYYSWSGAKNRCRNPKNKDYNKYGGRGITFDARWDDYRVFLADMGRKPHPTFSLERIDVNGPYSKENCKWASIKEQNNNRRIYMIDACELTNMRRRLSAYEGLFGVLP